MSRYFFSRSGGDKGGSSASTGAKDGGFVKDKTGGKGRSRSSKGASTGAKDGGFVKDETGDKGGSSSSKGASTGAKDGGFVKDKTGDKGGSSGSKGASTGAKEGGFVMAKTGGFTSHTTLLVNNTNKTLYLRDKVGAAYGGTRYKIPGNSTIEVSPLQHTFFKMLAYAVEEGSVDGKEREGESGNLQNPSHPQQSKASKEKKTSTDTKLTIDSDQLTDNKKIVITCKEGPKYELSLLPR